MNIMSNIKRIIVNYFNMFYCMFIPKKNNRIAFGSWMGQKYDDNSRYLFEYMLNDIQYKDYEIYWITSNMDVYNMLINEKKPVMHSDSIEAKKYLKKAKFVFYTTNEIDIGKNNIGYIGGAVIVNLWHGIPIKKIMYDDKFSKLNKNKLKDGLKRAIRFLPYRKSYIVSTSETVSNIYKRAFKMKLKNIVVLGQPRNDVFYINHENYYKKRFRNKKIILYMPTHRNEGKDVIDINSIIDLEKMNAWCEENEYVFVIKKHFYHRNEQIIDNNRFDSVIEITNETTDSQELLDSANILITDYSSCYIDYLLLNRPIIFYDYDIDWYQMNDREMYFNYDDVTPGYKCKDFDSLMESLKLIECGKDEYKEKRNDVKKIFYSSCAQKNVSADIIRYFLNIKRSNND